MPSIEQIEKLLAAEPDDVLLNFGLAMEYVRAGRTDDAARQFARVLELDGNYTPAYQQWARALIAANRHAEAREILARGLASAQATGNTHAYSTMKTLLDAIPN